MGADVIVAPAATRSSCIPLRVVGADPQADAAARLGERVEVDARQRFPHREGDRLRREDDRVRRPRPPSASQAQALLVERRRALEVAHLQGDEVGSDRGHVLSFLVCQNIDI